MVEIVMVICLAIILFILIRRFPETAEKLEAEGQANPIKEKNQPDKKPLIVSKQEEVEADPPKYSAPVNKLILEARDAIEIDKYQLAEEKLIEAIKSDKHCATAYTLLGDINYKQKSFVEAEESYLAAIKRDPEESEAHFGLASIYLAKEKPNEAVKELILATRLEPKNDLWQAKLGEVYMELRIFSKAAIAFHRASNIKPDYQRYKKQASEAEEKQKSHKSG